tara:strand:+ start:124 stop:1239 length:1116 start_codon:yes stop_codon:yes gene_type:complete
MIVNEREMLDMLSGAGSIALVEPQYKRKYPPLGLAKIEAFARANGIAATFSRGYDGRPADLICVATLWTYDWDRVLETLSEVAFLAPTTPVLVGGVLASLMTKKLAEAAPSVAVFPGYSPTLDRYAPDWSLPWGVEQPWGSFSYVFTSRGCANKCAYCAVPRIEPGLWTNAAWSGHIDPSLPNVMVSDNNLSSMPREHLSDVLGVLAESGKKIVFDNGFDNKLIDPEMAADLARLKYTRKGMRLAFDRIEEEQTFGAAVERLIAAGVSRYNIMAYVLFNFTDSPGEADHRMRVCADLGIRPYPQKYTPLNATSRKPPHVSKRWTLRLLRAFREFWLFAGHYNRGEFGDFLTSDKAAKFKLGPDDLSAWAQR